MASWSSFDEFESIIKSYTPSYGEGNIMSEQIVTAINKLIYKWFNDGDVYDNRYFMQGWCNDLSSYANWLYEYVNLTELDEIETVKGDEEYSNLLFKVAKKCLNLFSRNPVSFSLAVVHHNYILEQKDNGGLVKVVLLSIRRV